MVLTEMVQDMDPVDVSTFENLTGSDHGDRLTGDHRDNMLTGGAGDDTLRGMAEHGYTLMVPGETILTVVRIRTKVEITWFVLIGNDDGDNMIANLDHV